MQSLKKSHAYMQWQKSLGKELFLLIPFFPVFTHCLIRFMQQNYRIRHKRKDLCFQNVNHGSQILPVRKQWRETSPTRTHKGNTFMVKSTYQLAPWYLICGQNTAEWHISSLSGLPTKHNHHYSNIICDWHTAHIRILAQLKDNANVGLATAHTILTVFCFNIL